MKTVNDYSAIPAQAAYLGSEQPDGTMTEATAEALDRAREPIIFRDEDGTRHFFELQP